MGLTKPIKPTKARRSLVSYPLLSVIYQFFHICSIILRLPTWILSYLLVPAWRLHPKWTLRRTLLVRIGRSLVVMIGRVEGPEALSLEPGKEGDQFVTIEPTPTDVYKGPLKSDIVAPAAIGATWYPKRPDHLKNLGADEIVVLHIHGGAFITGDGRKGRTGFLASTLIEHAGATAVFMPQYRLACRPASDPFPAALQDCLTAYLHLVRVEGVPARNITIAGDSAGGNIAIGLVRYLAEFGPQLGIPQPQSAVFISPWTCPERNLLRPGAVTTGNPNYRTDILSQSILRWGAREYSRLVPVTDPYISPLGRPFATRVPLLINIGETELFAADCAQWAREMQGVDGNLVEVNYEADAPHDTLLLGDMLGRVEGAQEVARVARDFVKKSQGLVGEV